jgi:hypothetical protein
MDLFIPTSRCKQVHPWTKALAGCCLYHVDSTCNEDMAWQRTTARLEDRRTLRRNGKPYQRSRSFKELDLFKVFAVDKTKARLLQMRSMHAKRGTKARNFSARTSNISISRPSESSEGRVLVFRYHSARIANPLKCVGPLQVRRTAQAGRRYPPTIMSGNFLR